MKIVDYRRREAFVDKRESYILAKRVLRATMVFLMLISLAAVATIVVYWSLNNGTIARFSW
jgi:hypothetical protein